MKTRCAEWELLLERYHDGEVNRDEKRKLEAHLSTCGGCQAALRDLERLGRSVGLPARQALERLPAMRFDQMRERIAAAMREERRPSWAERLGVWFEEFWGANRRVVLAAAGAACLTLLVAWPLLRSGRTGQVPGSGSSPNEVIVDSVQSGEHDMVLVNVHPEDMTTVIWLLNDKDDEKPVDQAASPTAPGSGAASGAPDGKVTGQVPAAVPAATPPAAAPVSPAAAPHRGK